ncbi:MAG: hypothetical protein Tp178MES00d2C33159851_153 [Prokaryotic dsDNA virus sp.]|nr:MAG: hypothetical protein Tp178MES00d2C33159851_153 [Prokaryotic dsDNA virus sp.]|tara:strand:- start:7192 stop:7410 length:219 start_codon:yes stop_codon:yes gene_type:complete
MNNTWTQELPKVSGYYWFSYEYEDIPSISWFEVEYDGVSIWDHYDDGPRFMQSDFGYWYSAHPIETLPWRIK